MAEGGIQASSVAIDSMLCENCRDDDSFRHGTWFCQQCGQRLCDTCRKDHNMCRNTHALTLAGMVTATNPQPQEGASDELRVPMCHLHTLSIEFYCQKHITPVCNTCKLMEHRKCKLQDIEKAAAATSAGRNEKILQEMREIVTEMETIEGVIGEEKMGLQTQKTVIVEKIKENMKAIEVLGQKMIAEAEDKFKKECENLEQKSRDLTQSKNLAEKSIKDLERVSQVGSKEEIFVATRKTENDLSRFTEFLHDSSKVRHAVIDFHLERRLENLTSVGDISVDYSNANLTQEVTEVLNTGYTCDEIRIPWFDILPNEHLILLCHDESVDAVYASYLSLYSGDGACLNRLDMDDSHEFIADAALILSGHQIIVPRMTNKELHLIDIQEGSLGEGPVIATAVQPCLILKYSDSSVLILAKSVNEWLFQIVDRAGKVRSHTALSAKLVYPKSMRMDRDRNTIYIVDGTKGCLGFNLQGDLIFHYTNADFDIYEGLAIDQRGALYLSAGSNDRPIYPYDLSCIIKLSPAGHELRKIEIGKKLPLQCYGNKLYMSGLNDQNLWMICYIYV